MARVNIYLPDDLAESVRSSDLNVSQLAQEAIRLALDARALDLWLEEVAALPPTGIDPTVIEDAVAAAKDELGLRG